MNRQRFNILLKDPSQVDNNDIRQLNEYRKKYPYFQSLYVVVAKALKEREHPKAEAFIKKAAIFSANRSYLKGIIEGDILFQTPEPSEDLSPEPPNAVAESTDQLQEANDVVKDDTPAKEPAPQASPKLEKSKEVTKATPVAEKEEKKPALKTKKKQSAKDDQMSYHPDLNELKATKSRIEALLRGEVPKEDPKKHDKEVQEIQNKVDSKIKAEATISAAKSTKKPRRANQIEIIEKFIAEDPRIDIKQKAAAESEPKQEDLAEKSLKAPDTFITETMANLMLKQGKTKKAIDIYQKLSLKFPEKSAYFASQIEKVKSEHNV